MSEQRQPPRVILEKSRTVRRRYQRSKKHFTFTASQIERIEREQEREARAKKLREREKRRVASKKKRAERESETRQERRRLGLPDLNEPPVPASQSLLSKFLIRPNDTNGTAEDDQSDMTAEQEDDEDDVSATESICYRYDFDRKGAAARASTDIEDTKKSITSHISSVSQCPRRTASVASTENCGDAQLIHKPTQAHQTEDCISATGGDEDEFSGSSIFLNDGVLAAGTTNDEHQTPSRRKQDNVLSENVSTERTGAPSNSLRVPDSNLNTSFLDDTAILLEEIVREGAAQFDTDEEFEQGLLEFGNLVGL